MFKVTFFWPDENNHQVLLVGSWGWEDRITMKKEGFFWRVCIKLNPGMHQFKFIVDNMYRDLIMFENCDDNFGGKNNILKVPTLNEFFASQTFKISSEFNETRPILNEYRCNCEFLHKDVTEHTCQLVGIGLNKNYNNMVKLHLNPEKLQNFLEELFSFLQEYNEKQSNKIRWINFSELAIQFDKSCIDYIQSYLKEKNNSLYHINFGSGIQFCEDKIIKQIEAFMKDNQQNPILAKKRVEKI